MVRRQLLLSDALTSRVRSRARSRECVCADRFFPRSEGVAGVYKPEARGKATHPLSLRRPVRGVFTFFPYIPPNAAHNPCVSKRFDIPISPVLERAYLGPNTWSLWSTSRSDRSSWRPRLEATVFLHNSRRSNQ